MLRGCEASVADARPAGTSPEPARAEDILRASYWCLRATLCGAAGPPASWVDGPPGPEPTPNPREAPLPGLGGPQRPKSGGCADSSWSD